jgi:hypothetical protein
MALYTYSPQDVSPADPCNKMARNDPAGSTGLPDAQQPYPVEILLRKAIERGVVDVSQGDWLAGLM